LAVALAGGPGGAAATDVGAIAVAAARIGAARTPRLKTVELLVGVSTSTAVIGTRFGFAAAGARGRQEPVIWAGSVRQFSDAIHTRRTAVGEAVVLTRCRVGAALGGLRLPAALLLVDVAERRTGGRTAAIAVARACAINAIRIRETCVPAGTAILGIGEKLEWEDALTVAHGPQTLADAVPFDAGCVLGTFETALAAVVDVVLEKGRVPALALAALLFGGTALASTAGVATARHPRVADIAVRRAVAGIGRGFDVTGAEARDGAGQSAGREGTKKTTARETGRKHACQIVER
jgi:hypothetical protein